MNDNGTPLLIVDSDYDQGDLPHVAGAQDLRALREQVRTLKRDVRALEVIICIVTIVFGACILALR